MTPPVESPFELFRRLWDETPLEKAKGLPWSVSLRDEGLGEAVVLSDYRMAAEAVRDRVVAAAWVREMDARRARAREDVEFDLGKES